MAVMTWRFLSSHNRRQRRIHRQHHPYFRFLQDKEPLHYLRDCERPARVRQEEETRFPLLTSTFISLQEKNRWVLGSLQRTSTDAERFKRLQGCSNCTSCTCKLLIYLTSDLIAGFRDNAFVSKINLLSKCLSFRFVWVTQYQLDNIFFSLELSSTYLDFSVSPNILVYNIHWLEIII